MNSLALSLLGTTQLGRMISYAARGDEVKTEMLQVARKSRYDRYVGHSHLSKRIEKTRCTTGHAASSRKGQHRKWGLAYDRCECRWKGALKLLVVVLMEFGYRRREEVTR